MALDLKAYQLKRGDKFTYNGIEFTLRGKPVFTETSYVIPVTTNGTARTALTVDKSVTFSVERAGAVVHAADFRGMPACTGRANKAALTTSSMANVTCRDGNCAARATEYQAEYQAEKVAARKTSGVSTPSYPYNYSPERYSKKRADYRATWRISKDGTVTISSDALGEFTAPAGRWYDLKAEIAAVESAISSAMTAKALQSRHPDVEPDYEQ